MLLDNVPSPSRARRGATIKSGGRTPAGMGEGRGGGDACFNDSQ